MSKFALQRLSLPENLRPAHGVLRVAALAATSDAQRLVEDMLQQARQDAEQVRQAAARQAQQAVAQQQQEVVQQGSLLLQGLQQAQDDMLAQVEDLVVALASEVVDRLLLELTPRERIAAMLRRVRQEAPPKLHDAVLWVHPDDQAYLPPSPWEIQVDAAQAAGSCRLEASSGEWRSDFALAVQALREGLAGAAASLKQGGQP